MMQYILGYLAGEVIASKMDNNQQNIDYNKIDIKKLEVVLRNAKFTQEPEKYTLTEETLDKYREEGKNIEAVNLINKLLDESRITAEESIILYKELKVHK